MTDPVRVIADSVRTRARRGTLGGTPQAAVREELQRYAEHAFSADVPLIADEGRAEREVVADLTGFGQLQPLLDDPSIEEVWINAPNPRNYAEVGASVRPRSADGVSAVRRSSSAAFRVRSFASGQRWA